MLTAFTTYYSRLDEACGLKKTRRQDPMYFSLSVLDVVFWLLA